MRVVSLVLFALLVLATTSQAATVVSSERVVAGPVLSGPEGAVTWVSGHPRKPLRVRTSVPGARRPVTIARLPYPRAVATHREVVQGVFLHGDADGSIAVSYAAGDVPPAPGDPSILADLLFTGPSRGPLTRAYGCVLGEGTCARRACAGIGVLAPTGTVRLDRPTCSGAEELVRRDGTGAAIWTVSTRAYTGFPVSAGPYVALAEHADLEGAACLFPTQTTVRDADTGAPALITPVLGDRCLAAIDVTAQGVLATLTQPPRTFGPFRLDWCSVDDPVEHVVDARISPYSALAAAGRGIVADVQRGRRTELTRFGLNGSRQVVAGFNGSTYRDGDIDYDGTHVVWVERGCEGRRIVVATPSRPRADPPARCE